LPGADGDNRTLVLLRDLTFVKHTALSEERERIATDLHDGVIQSLYAVMLSLSALERSGELDRSATVRLSEATVQISDIIQVTRDYVFGLQPEHLAEDALPSGLQVLAEEIRAHSAAQVKIDIGMAPDALLDPEVVGNLLLIAREATWNAIKHADATTIQLRLSAWGEQIALSVCDNGRGFDTKTREEGFGYGLRSMKKRAAVIGAELFVDSALAKGTEIRLELHRLKDPLGGGGRK
jgi:signal transduction histidine kinase